MFEKIKNLHFVGIGGSGMSGIAEVFHNLGYRVTGSDMQDSMILKRLRSMGIKTYIGHRKGHITGAHVVVTSTAIAPDNREVKAAHAQGIPVIPRIEMLAELARLKYTVSVAGTHGKTTTTSMLALILQEGGLDPTIVVGGIIKNIGTGAKLGRGNFLIAEADESDGSFLKLSPTIVVVTNIDNDHLDNYGTMCNLLHAFTEHCNRVPFYGRVILNGDDHYVRQIIPDLHRKIITFGLRTTNDYYVKNISYDEHKTTSVLIRKGKRIGTIQLCIPGRHNVLNGMAAAVAGLELGIPFSKIQYALKEFSGVKRRIEIKGECRNIIVVDDYGHHPTEISEVFKTIRQLWPHRRLVVLFQPHRFSRTKLLHKEFCSVLRRADVVRLLPIYPAAEKPIPGVTAQLLVRGLKKIKKEASVVRMYDSRLIRELRPGDIFLTLGAGPVWKVGEWLLQAAPNNHSLRSGTGQGASPALKR